MFHIAQVIYTEELGKNFLLSHVIIIFKRLKDKLYVKIN